MRLNETMLIKYLQYSSLVRYILHYACFISNSNNLSANRLQELEIIENKSLIIHLLIIFKLSRAGLVPIEQLRKHANITSIKVRLDTLSNRYIEKCLHSKPASKRNRKDYSEIDKSRRCRR